MAWTFQNQRKLEFGRMPNSDEDKMDFEDNVEHFFEENSEPLYDQDYSNRVTYGSFPFSDDDHAMLLGYVQK